jgi:c-di-GMP-binding flagellar brake protein YcgR
MIMAELSLNQQKYQQMAVPDEDQYRLTERVEILRALRSLIQQRAMVNAFFNADNDMVLTSVLAVDADNEAIYFDYGPNDALNRRMTMGEVTFMSSPGSVKLQFSVPKVVIAMYDNQPTFRTPVPTKMRLLQRREYHRVDLPVGNPLVCEMPTPDGTRIKLQLADLSIGGISMVIGNTEADKIFEKGTTVPGCRIALPEMGMLEATLNVQAVFPITRKDGTKVPHLGCQFVDLRMPMETLIQKYITKLERERLARGGAS